MRAAQQQFGWGAHGALGGEHVWAPPADISPSNPGREFSVSASGAGHRDYPAVCHRRGSFEGVRKNATPLLQGALLRVVREVMSA